MSYAALSTEEELPPAIVREPERKQVPVSAIAHVLLADGPMKTFAAGIISGDDAPIILRQDTTAAQSSGPEYGMWIWVRCYFERWFMLQA
jgi:hypothetical protein